MRSIEWWYFQWPWRTLTRFSRSRHFWSRISDKRLKDKVTIAQEETIPNILNGTMFGDLDWPLNASRRFVSVRWISCLCLSPGWTSFIMLRGPQIWGLIYSTDCLVLAFIVAVLRRPELLCSHRFYSQYLEIDVVPVHFYLWTADVERAKPVLFSSRVSVLTHDSDMWFLLFVRLYVRLSKAGYFFHEQCSQASLGQHSRNIARRREHSLNRLSLWMFHNVPSKRTRSNVFFRPPVTDHV